MKKTHFTMNTIEGPATPASLESSASHVPSPYNTPEGNLRVCICLGEQNLKNISYTNEKQN